MFTLRINPTNDSLLIANVNNSDLPFYSDFSVILKEGTKRECLEFAQEYWSENYISDENQMLLQLK